VGKGILQPPPNSENLAQVVTANERKVVLGVIIFFMTPKGYPLKNTAAIV
jgi:hypothetical protein